MMMLASLPGRYGVPALRRALMLSAQPWSPVIDSVSNLPALEALTKRRPVTCPSVQVWPVLLESVVDNKSYTLDYFQQSNSASLESRAALSLDTIATRQDNSNDVGVCGSQEVIDTGRHRFKVQEHLWVSVWETTELKELFSVCKESAFEKGTQLSAAEQCGSWLWM